MCHASLSPPLTIHITEPARNVFPRHVFHSKKTNPTQTFSPPFFPPPPPPHHKPNRSQPRHCRTSRTWSFETSIRAHTPTHSHTHPTRTLGCPPSRSPKNAFTAKHRPQTCTTSRSGPDSVRLVYAMGPACSLEHARHFNRGHRYLQFSAVCHDECSLSHFYFTRDPPVQTCTPSHQHVVVRSSLLPDCPRLFPSLVTAKSNLPP
jgi:hypothetical protein